ncbi:acyl-CoA dehydrogenase C-terminal domain-containing protein [Streptomyces sp. NPDC060064]|uniref:acyl-CoA dehydrogenase C-terminal domain-containing protein n=1 Tax=Streptomyces sp. NPDC060064 TaxID=3347049 RepID=UPI0036783141
MPFLTAVGELVVGWRLLIHTEVAATAPDDGAGATHAAFYEGKTTAAKLFAATVPPGRLPP